jgi:hypothetical protein
LGDKEVASAQAGWGKVSSYLGWLQLSVEDGGAGLPESELHTLAWIAVPDYLVQYLEWRKKRAGGSHTTFVPELMETRVGDRPFWAAFRPFRSLA